MASRILGRHSADNDEDRLLENREIMLCGEIDDDLAQKVVMKMLYLQHQDPHATITLHVGSPGGSVSSALAIYDTIDVIVPPVAICCHRFVAGMASIIAAHGAKGRRFAESDSTLSLSASYPAYNFAGREEGVDKTNGILADLLAKDTGRSVEEVAATMEAGVCFSAIEAREFGLIDTIERCHTRQPLS